MEIQMRKFLVVLFSCVLAPISASAQDFGAKDIDSIKEAYKANQVRFERDYVGKHFDATMPLHSFQENMFIDGAFTASFGKGLISDVACGVDSQGDLDFLIEKNKGDPIHVAGFISDVGIGDIKLKDCSFQ